MARAKDKVALTRVLGTLAVGHDERPFEDPFLHTLVCRKFFYCHSILPSQFLIIQFFFLTRWRIWFRWLTNSLMRCSALSCLTNSFSRQLEKKTSSATSPSWCGTCIKNCHPPDLTHLWRLFNPTFQAQKPCIRFVIKLLKFLNYSHQCFFYRFTSYWNRGLNHTKSTQHRLKLKILFWVVFQLHCLYD